MPPSHHHSDARTQAHNLERAAEAYLNAPTQAQDAAYEKFFHQIQQIEKNPASMAAVNKQLAKDHHHHPSLPDLKLMKGSDGSAHFIMNATPKADPPGGIRKTGLNLD